MPHSSGPFPGQRPDHGTAPNGADTSSVARSRPNYEEWYAGDGEFAVTAQHLLLRRMISGWPRRGHNLLEMFCGSGNFLESFWEDGFDVTGQEHDQGLVRRARRRLGNRVSITLNRPEHLPFDDRSFDYVTCLNGLEFADDPEATLRECFRLATYGLLLAFPCTLSMRGLGLLLTEKARAFKQSWPCAKRNAKTNEFSGGPACGQDRAPETDFSSKVAALEPDGILPYGSFRQFSPFKIMSLARKYSPPARVSWGSILLGPAGSWKTDSLCGRLNSFTLPLPIGACAMLRLDFAPAYGGTPLPLHTGRDKQTANAAMAKESLAGKSLFEKSR